MDAEAAVRGAALSLLLLTLALAPQTAPTPGTASPAGRAPGPGWRELPPPAPNGRIPLYLMGEPEGERMGLAVRSEVVEAAGLSEGEREALRGVRLILYDWIFGEYEDELGEGYGPGDLLVEFDGPYGRAFAFDYGNPDARRLRVGEILDEVEGGGYSGVFFDWFAAACDGEIAEESAPGYLEEFRRRHPGETVRGALMEFLAELRGEAAERGIDLLIVANQAYRCGPEVMAAVDWDVSESYFTDVDRDGRTVLFPWDASGNWDSPATYVPELVSAVYDRARELNFRLGFTHVSYAAPGDRDAAFYAYAGARVFGHDGIATSVSGAGGEVEPDGVPNVYWLGCWRGSTGGDGWAVGEYDLGVVAAGSAPARVPDRLVGRKVYDLYSGTVGELPRVIRVGGTWGRVFLLLPDEVAEVRCPGWSAEVPVYSPVSEGALAALAALASGGCEVEVSGADEAAALRAWSFWREPTHEVTVLANDIDWNLSGVILEAELGRMGVEVRRSGPGGDLRAALLDSAAVVLLGGPRSPGMEGVVGPLAQPGGPGVYDLGPGRILIWIWGEDRYETRAEVLSRLPEVLSAVEDVLSPLPRCHRGSG